MKGVSECISLSCGLMARIGSIGGLGVLIAIPALAQQAELSGAIEDPGGGRVENAAIKVINEDTQANRSTESNSSGFYSVPELPPGHYRVEVDAQGFQKVNRTGIILEVAQIARLDFRLEVSATAETVNVSADASPINTSDASVSMTVSSDLVENLPLNGRSFQQLITLAPGVNLTGGANSDNGEFSVNGQRPTSNYFTVDGVSANLGSTISGGNFVGSGETLNAAGGTNSLVSVDALQEFRILTSSFAPEYGRTPGGQVILLTRSGTNIFHGTLFEYFRNEVLDANDWFANRAGAERAALRFNDFGGTLGGPIIKDNTFFFISYEGELLRQPQFGITSVPDITSRQSAPAAVQPLLNAFPIPNGPELGNGLSEFSAGYSNPITANSTSLRVDHIFGPKLNSFARYNYAPSSDANRGGGGADALSDVVRNTFLSQSITGGLTYAITPHLVNETRINWSENSTPQTATFDTFGGATLPPTSALYLPPYTPQDSLALVDLGGSVRYLVGAYIGAIPRQVNILDSVSYAVGTHQLKFGADYLRSLPIHPDYASDIYLFNSVANAVNNTMVFINVNDPLVRTDATNLSLYAQDTWRASPRLTLTYGLRWDLNPPPRDRYSNNGNYVPLLGNYITGTVSVGTAGSSLWNTQYTNFGPRLGVAYELRQAPERETVLRVGGGLFYDVATEDAMFTPFGAGFPNSLLAVSSGVTAPVSPSLGVVPGVSSTNPPPGSTFYLYTRDFAAPRSWQWNVSIQQALGSAQTVTLSYVAALGRDLLYSQYYPSVGPNGYEVYLTGNSASSNYQSLQLLYQRRLKHGVAATASYAWSHSLDDSSNNDNPLPPVTVLSPHTNWGPSDFDIRHSFKAALSWSLPTPPVALWLKALTRGWGFDAILTARSALPVDITQRENIGFGNFALRPDVVPGQPEYLYGSKYPGGKAFNPAAFIIDPNAQGDLGRNALRGFDLVETDLSARRAFQVSERFKLVFRADFFNLFNHPNFADPDSGIGDGTFGQSIQMANGVLGGYGNSLNSVFETGGPRTIQFSLKLQF
jgi:hypothetical protein